MTLNPKELIDKNPLSSLQLATILVCFLMNMLDGMDVLIMSYTAQDIGKSWGIGPAAMGTVFSSGLLGMTIGTLFLAPFADIIGRKTIILISGIIMGVCIFLTSYASSFDQLIVYRFISGLGIGSMLASTASLAAEYTPNKTRDFWVSFVVSGYPVGAVLSGLIAAKVIPTEGWQQMFRIAGIASMFSVPLVLLFLSESLDYYLRTQPKNALAKANKIMAKMNFEPLKSLPPVPKISSKLPVDELLKSKFKKPTLQLWLALFLAFAALYFMTSWIPKLASDAGLSMRLSIYAGTVFNVGAFFGIITQGYFSSRFGLKKTLGVILVLTGLLMASFGFFVGSDIILLIFAFLGFGIQGGFVGLYALSARLYPTEFRTTGVGWAMGAGRIGGIVGPFMAGLLIAAGIGIGMNFLIFAIPAALAGLITANISSDEIS
jgi:MFS transporter, AAHS family, 4-hydroxybenzoate transporter